MRHELRLARRPRSEQDPFGLGVPVPLDRRAAGLGLGMRVEIVELGIRGCHSSYLREGLFAELWRAQHQPARNTVELEECNGRAQLLVHGEQHRSAAEVFRVLAETGGACELRQ
jgi:hypothetical protein